MNAPQTPTRRAGAWAATLTTAVALSWPAWPARGDDAGQRQQIEQKLRLAEQLTSDSPSAQRIAASGHAQAIAHLDEGRVYHALARDLLARGDIAGARGAVDEALRHIGQARRMVPDAAARLAAARARYEQLSASTDRLLQAYRERARRQTGGGQTVTESTSTQTLLEQARQDARQARFDPALQALLQAQQQLLEDMGRLVTDATLDYTARFSSPAEKFEHDLARYAGLQELLPLALAQLRPNPDAQVLVERYASTGRTLHAQALRHALAGEHGQATAALENAMLYLQRALLAAGLVTPTP